MKSKLQRILKKKNRSKLVCLTSYSKNFSQILDKYCDIVLVGDSLSNVLYGMKNTQHVTLEMMKEHGRAVAKNCKKSFTIVDMPYNTYNSNKQALLNIRNLLNYTKCQAIKIETDESKINLIKYLTKKKIKVVSHIGVTPQKYKSFDKIRSVGNSNEEKEKILNLALNIEKAGAFSIVLECISGQTSKIITKNLKIPTIGIGSSKFCDGQILVTDDMLGLSGFYPKFVKKYINLKKIISRTVGKFSKEVRNKKFPSNKNSF